MVAHACTHSTLAYTTHHMGFTKGGLCNCFQSIKWPQLGNESKWDTKPLYKKSHDLEWKWKCSIWRYKGVNPAALHYLKNSKGVAYLQKQENCLTANSAEEEKFRRTDLFGNGRLFNAFSPHSLWLHSLINGLWFNLKAGGDKIALGTFLGCKQ